MPKRSYAVIEAPSVLGLRPSGVEKLASAILRSGFATRIGARLAGRVDPPGYSPDREAESDTLNARAIAEWSPHLADAVGQVLDRGEFPVILGGDCSILLGAALALRRRGRFGLLFIDGHADFYQPEANPNGEAASMDLAFVVGYGPTLLTSLEGRRPLVRADDVVAFGFRDGEEQQRYGSQPLAADILALDLTSVRRLGVRHATEIALERLASSTLGFFVHLDADCLNDAIMPAVDYRLPDGFTWDELTSILSSAMASGRAVGLEVTIYNPALDDDGAAGRGLTDVLVAALGGDET